MNKKIEPNLNKYNVPILKKQNKLFLHFILVICSFFTVFLKSLDTFAVVIQDQQYSAGRLDFQINTEFYRSNANFDNSGTSKNLISDNYLQNIQFNPIVRWSALENLGIRSGFLFNMVESSDPLATRNSSNPSRIDLAADYRFQPNSNWEWILDFEYNYNIESVDNNTDNVLLSSGADEFKPSVLLRHLSQTFFNYGMLGFNYRTNGLSGLLTYQRALPLSGFTPAYFTR